MDTMSIIDRTRALLGEHYVFPDVAEKLDALLAARLASGTYDVAAPEELGVLVTEDLQSANGDRHLRLKFHPDEVPVSDDSAVMQEIAREFDLSLAGIPRLLRLAGGVAHLELAPKLFPIEWAADSITAAFSLAARAEALIIDLRANTGGDPNTVALVCGYLLDEPTHLNTMYHRSDDAGRQCWSPAYVPGKRFGATKPVYVLTSGRTFSAAEELAYDLQQLGRATIVGERTGGGAHPRRGFTVHPHLEATIPTARAINPVSGTNWELVGVAPDIEVPAADALDRAHREALAEPARQHGGDSPALAEARAALGS
jgi:C-terminal processing protease CtpA/Prc